MISHKQLIKTLNQAIYFYFIAIFKNFQELCQFFYISDSIWPQDADVHALDSGDFFLRNSNLRILRPHTYFILLMTIYLEDL